MVQIIATDDDVGLNGAVRYRLKADPAGHWKTFNLQPVSGILELRLPLNRDKQKIYDVSRNDTSLLGIVLNHEVLDSYRSLRFGNTYSLEF